MIVNSAADWGRSDPLKVAKAAEAMLAGGFDRAEVEKVVWDNPVAFFAQSGRLDLDAVKNSELSQGNSILRGERS